MSLTVDFWGVKGSLPLTQTPTELTHEFRQLMARFFNAGYTDPNQIDAFFRSVATPAIGGYGTATTCVQVSSQNQSMIIDAGSGLKGLGDHLMLGPAGRGDGAIHLFLTHFHWDHLLGFPHFKPAWIEGNEIHLYAVQPDLKALIKNYMKHPWVETSFSSWRCSTHFHILNPREPIQLNDLSITPFQMDHPDACWGYKITSGGKTYAHCADTEATRTSRQSLGEDLPMYQNVDLMYFDAQYTLGELADRKNWGHSASQIGLDLAFRENIKSVLFAHHDPISNSASIATMIKQTEEYYRWKMAQASRENCILPAVEWGFVYEGQQVLL